MLRRLLQAALVALDKRAQRRAWPPTLCPDCGGHLVRATDEYVVICWECDHDFTVDVPNDYLIGRRVR